MSSVSPSTYVFLYRVNKDGVIDMSSNKYVNVELRTNLESVKDAVEKAGIIRKVHVEMPWEELFKQNKIDLDEKLKYNVSSRNGCIISSIKKSVGEHIRKFAVPLQLYPVTIELNVKKEPVDNAEAAGAAAKQEPNDQLEEQQNENVVGAVAGAAAVEDRRPRHVILLENLLREQMQQLRDANQAEEEEDMESSSGNDSNYSSDEHSDNEEEGAPIHRCPYDNNVADPVEIIWDLPCAFVPEGRLLAASIIEAPKVDGVPFMNGMQIKMCAGMLVNRFGAETMLEKKFEFVNMMTDFPDLWKQLRDKSKFMCDFITAIFSDDMFNPTPRRDQDFM